MARYSLEELNDLEEIRAVKYRYLRCLDQKDWQGLAATLAPDATAAYSGGKYSYDGRDEIMAFIEGSMGREQFHSSHRAHHPEIALAGDSATGVWALEDIVVDLEWDFVLLGAAFYDDSYERRDGQWLITRTSYRRSFEMVFPASSVEGMRLTASWWGTGGASTLPAG